VHDQRKIMRARTTGLALRGGIFKDRQPEAVTLDEWEKVIAPAISR
jgi:hypothetical protein